MTPTDAFPDIPPFYYPLRPNHHRRALWHDYTAPGSYLLTFSKAPAIPLFSDIVGQDQADAHTALTHTGTLLEEALQNYCRDFPMTEIRSHVVMPDHMHALVHVPIRLKKHLSFYISKLMGRITRVINGPDVASADLQSAFIPGYNDRILTINRSLQTWQSYVEDNPRRLWLMRNRSRYFERGRIVVSPARSFPTYGNALLLDYPERQIVRYSSHYTRQEWEDHKAAVMRVAENGGVLISPFIHADEKALRDEVLEMGGRIIHVVEGRFAPRDKPSKREFEVCAEGRALIISRTHDIRKKDVMTREIAMRLNRMAKWLVETSGLSIRHGY